LLRWARRVKPTMKLLRGFSKVKRNVNKEIEKNE